MTNRLATSMIALSTALATPALADVTAADVWANQQALYEAMGVTLSGSLSGASLINPEINIVLPGGFAAMSIKTVALTMTDNGDGTVNIAYPSPMAITVEGGVRDEGSFTLYTTMSHDGYTITASGTPGDISYDSDAQNIRLEIGDLLLDQPGSQDQDVDLEGSLTLDGWTGTSNVKEGNLITYTSDLETGETVADFTFTIENVVSSSTQTSQPVSSQTALSLPAGGSDVMNLSAALRSGLDVAIETSGGGSNSTSKATLNGETMNSQETTTGPQTVDLTFNEDGLIMSGDAQDFAMTFFDNSVFPAPLDFALEAVTFTYDLPVNASEDAQDFRLATSMQGLTLGDTIWNLFDPAGQLPRDPAEVSFDLTGFGTTGTDLLNFIAMQQAGSPPDVQVDELTLENLTIAVAGAEATATGAFTLDNTDMETFPGFPRPEGGITINLNGANALMDRLVAMGLVPEDQLMMPRMMLGMFATPVGDDALESVLEINEAGEVLANGQRLR